MTMSKWFFTSDLHLDHANIIRYCNRPFGSVEEMNEGIIGAINDSVGHKDNLLILGDFCLVKASNALERYSHFRSQIRCKNVTLVLGNHDREEELSRVFGPCPQIKTLKVDGNYIVCSHYPMRSWDRAAHGSWMLYGHVHNAYRNEDEAGLSTWKDLHFRKVFSSILARHGAESQQILNELMTGLVSLSGSDLTLDVGVDNVRHGKAFGAPWSLDEVAEIMAMKLPLWEMRRQISNRC